MTIYKERITTGLHPEDRQKKQSHGTGLKTVILSISALLCLLSPGSAWSGEKASPTDNQPWHIMADSLILDSETGVYTAAGNVIITKDAKTLQSDFLKYNTKTSQSEARGNIKFQDKDGVLTADSLEMNLDTEQGTVTNGTLFIESNHMYIKGASLNKTGENTYMADRVTVSTCDGDAPDWKISAQNLKVTIEGYGTVRHATFWAKKVPVLYAPYFLFPAKIKRQTGLLPPRISFSDRKGSELEVPFFWAISDSSDATFYTSYMSERGVKFGAEYRYASDKDSFGTYMYDYMKDDKIDDGTDANKDYGYGGDAFDRTNEKRYWLRMKQNNALPLGISAKLDVDVVSDQDYLREFGDGYNGFDATDSYFKNEFGRNLDDDEVTTRKNSLTFTRNWSRFNLNSQFLWYDNVTARRNDTEDTTLQRLPKVEFNGSKQAIAKTPLYFDLDSEYTYFYRPDTNSTNATGFRSDIYPRLYLPFRLGNYLSLEPSAGYRYTYWNIESNSDIEDEDKGSHNRGIHDIKLDASTDLYKVSNFRFGGIDKIKHVIKPQVIYEFIPNQDQDDLPNFDDTDRIEEKKLVTYSLTNTFTYRKKPAQTKGPNPPQTSKANYIYREFCRFKLEQSYDINEADENDPTKFNNGVTREPFSPIKGDLEIDPTDWLSFDADFTWTRYEREILTRNESITLQNGKKDRFSLEHRFSRDPKRSVYKSEGLDTSGLAETTESIKGSLFFNLTDRVALYGGHERDLHEGKNIESTAGMIYTSQCWALDISYTDEDEDEKYALLLTLTGLGGFGTGISADSLKK